MTRDHLLAVTIDLSISLFLLKFSHLFLSHINRLSLIFLYHTSLIFSKFFLSLLISSKFLLSLFLSNFFLYYFFHNFILSSLFFSKFFLFFSILQKSFSLFFRAWLSIKQKVCSLSFSSWYNSIFAPDGLFFLSFFLSFPSHALFKGLVTVETAFSLFDIAAFRLLTISYFISIICLVFPTLFLFIFLSILSSRSIPLFISIICPFSFPTLCLFIFLGHPYFTHYFPLFSSPSFALFISHTLLCSFSLGIFLSFISIICPFHFPLCLFIFLGHPYLPATIPLFHLHHLPLFISHTFACSFSMGILTYPLLFISIICPFSFPSFHFPFHFPLFHLHHLFSFPLLIVHFPWASLLAHYSSLSSPSFAPFHFPHFAFSFSLGILTYPLLFLSFISIICPFSFPTLCLFIFHEHPYLPTTIPLYHLHHLPLFISHTLLVHFPWASLLTHYYSSLSSPSFAPFHFPHFACSFSLGILT
ncbi:unnamed protein product [Acanthosepion pharaonis]|uniref:Uncharacterized protein n=1 Tax=Acanthosepion pharaonis TaxID=158019 RepID=A0A812B1K3_ACAPH|nr:unnamed protein product [Sepia pharaonis]